MYTVTEQSKKPIKVILTEDHDGMRTAIRSYLTKIPGINVVGETSSGADLLDRLPNSLADFLFLDFNLRDTTANLILPRIRRVKPRLRVLIVSAIKDAYMAREMVLLGAAGYLLKDDLVPYASVAVREIMDGNCPWFSPSMPLKGKKELFEQTQELVETSIKLMTNARRLMEKSQVLEETSRSLQSRGDNAGIFGWMGRPIVD